MSRLIRVVAGHPGILLVLSCSSVLSGVIVLCLDMQRDIDENDQEHEVGHSALADRLDKLTSDYADLQQLVGAHC